MNNPKPYNIYTEANVASPAIPIAADEGILSITVEPDGTNVVTIDVLADNLDHSDQISCKGPWADDWQGALVGPGSVTFGNLGTGHFVVTTVKR
jgi:hypothetical protein